MGMVGLGVQRGGRRSAECVQIAAIQGGNEVQGLKMKQCRSRQGTCSSRNVPELASVNGL